MNYSLNNISNLSFAHAALTNFDHLSTGKLKSAVSKVVNTNESALMQDFLHSVIPDLDALVEVLELNLVEHSVALVCFLERLLQI